ncbi:Lymphocyte expansion molecule [Holothuria leucospilota]|uniref:Lymphocyte expansion molecule n=1 Tax=Holothuria leucospilota TaxID=206669 RepID=A0A9Q1HBA7_HOLLE|nr:Lymphocyte expansion molecule [Holothuria leucospilota]
MAATVKAFSGAPFGTQKARFDVSGVHPQSKTPGTFTQVWYDKKATSPLERKRGPGTYKVELGSFAKHEVDRKSSGPGWARAYEVSRMAAMPHLLHKEQWEKKRMIERNLGPGTHNIDDFVKVMSDRPCSKRGICQTRERRFRHTATSEVPGPGTYGEGGVPHSAVEKKSRESTSTVGMLDAGSSTPRHLPTVGCELGPGTYQHKTFTEERTEKVTSIRGPYDLFTGERNATVKTGHFAKPGRHPLGPGQYNLDSFADKWQDEHNHWKGRFSKISQYPTRPGERIFCSTLSQWPRKEREPGPGSYTVKKLSKPSATNSPAFISSAERFDKRARKFFTGQTNPVGPGRYDVQTWNECQHQNGHQSVFNSKVMRSQSLARDLAMQERITGSGRWKEETVSRVKDQPATDYIRARKVIYTQSV